MDLLKNKSHINFYTCQLTQLTGHRPKLGAVACGSTIFLFLFISLLSSLYYSYLFATLRSAGKFQNTLFHPRLTYILSILSLCESDG